jgi:8-oxo-dGTP pyrophosphatase MutT (NUDIX family)
MAWIENEWGEVLLVRQAAGLRLWTLPGGKVKPREALLAALQREVWEETKHKIEVDEFLDLMDRPERGAISLLFRVNTIKKGSNLRLPNEEILDLRYVKKPPKHLTPSATYFWKRRKQGIYNWVADTVELGTISK